MNRSAFLLLAALAALALSARADVVLKNQGTTRGPITILNFVDAGPGGAGVSVDRTGSTGTVTVP